MRLVVEKIKEHVQEGHVAEITWVKVTRYWAHGLTKKTVDMTGLVDILKTGKHLDGRQRGRVSSGKKPVGESTATSSTTSP